MPLLWSGVAQRGGLLITLLDSTHAQKTQKKKDNLFPFLA
jgi:hypothetical protein